jgi:maleamate amidohydrolase
MSAEERREYGTAGWGGTVGFGTRPALLVVDMYRAFVDPEYPYSSRDSLAPASNIRVLIDAFRRHRFPVIFTTSRPAANDADRGRWKSTANRGEQMAAGGVRHLAEIEPIAGGGDRQDMPERFLRTTCRASWFMTRLTR